MLRVCLPGEARGRPNKGDTGTDTPIFLGRAGPQRGPGLNPACSKAGLGEAAWPPAVCCKTMSQPGTEGSGGGEGLEGPLPHQPCLRPFPGWVLLTPARRALRKLTHFLFCCLAAIGKVLKNRKCPRQENTLKAETRNQPALDQHPSGWEGGSASRDSIPGSSPGWHLEPWSVARRTWRSRNKW